MLPAPTTPSDPLRDPLTGLANRRLFADRLAHALTRRSDSPSPVVVLYCDVDEFSEVNRRWGREAGDALILQIGQRMQDNVREGDTVARVDGDAFAILMDDADLGVAAEMAVRLERALAEPFDLPPTRLVLRTSIGVAEAMPGEDCGTDTLHHADVAMQWAKGQARSTVAVWSPALHERTKHRRRCAPTCAARWPTTSWCCTTSRPSTSTPRRSPASRRWSAGTTPSAACWPPRSSCRSPSRAA